MNEIEEIAEQRRIARILCQDEKGKCLHNSTSCESHIECAFTIWAQKLLNAGYGDVKQAVREFAERIETLCKEHKDRYSHLCKSTKECNDETCRYQGVLRLHNEIKELVKEVCGE